MYIVLGSNNLFFMLDKIYNYFGVDGLLHIICSIIIVRFSDLFLPLWTAALIAAVIGVSKEIIWDKLLKKGTFDKKDMIADAKGIAIGCL